MGQKISKRINILVVGLTGSGKTHFIDCIQGLESLTKRPTFGIEMVGFNDFNFIEWGGSINWEKIEMDVKVDCIYFIIKDQIDDANNSLIMISEMFPLVPIAIVWNTPKRPINYPRGRPVCSISIEKEGQLLEWTRQNACKDSV